jgi:hypothetical protein
MPRRQFDALGTVTPKSFWSRKSVDVWSNTSVAV